MEPISSRAGQACRLGQTSDPQLAITVIGIDRMPIDLAGATAVEAEGQGSPVVAADHRRIEVRRKLRTRTPDLRRLHDGFAARDRAGAGDPGRITSRIENIPS